MQLPTFRRHSIMMGCLKSCLTLTAPIIMPVIVSQNDNHVWKIVFVGKAC
jgi:hypothetical protein